MQKGKLQRPASIPYWLFMLFLQFPSTMNGAKALGLEGVTDSLSVGKDADMVAVSFAAPTVRKVVKSNTNIRAQKQWQYMWAIIPCF